MDPTEMMRVYDEGFDPHGMGSRYFTLHQEEEEQRRQFEIRPIEDSPLTDIFSEP